jgi:hypothetical protein
MLQIIDNVLFRCIIKKVGQKILGKQKEHVREYVFFQG